MTTNPGIQPTTTRAGRVVKPTFKVREMIRSTVFDVFRKVLLRLEDLEFKTRRAMKKGGPAASIRTGFGEWSLCHEELVEAGSEYCKLLSEDELVLHQASWSKKTSKYVQFRQDVNEFLSSVGVDRVKARSNVRELLNIETSRLEREISKIESRISGARSLRGESSCTLSSLGDEFVSPRLSSTEVGEDLVSTWLYPEETKVVGGDQGDDRPAVESVLPLDKKTPDSTAEALNRLADLLSDKRAKLPQIEPEVFGHLGSLNSIDEMVKILRILPGYMSERWDRCVDRWCYSAPPDFSNGNVAEERSYPPFSELCKFVAQEARVINGPTRTLLNAEEKLTGGVKTGTKPVYKSTVHNTGAEEEDREYGDRPYDDDPAGEWGSDAGEEAVVNAISAGGKPPVVPKCFFCQGDHWIVDCGEFMGMVAEKRKEFAVNAGLCFGCLRRSHTYRSCRSRNPALLSDEKKEVKGAVSLRTLAADEDVTGSSGFMSSIVMAEVHHVDDPSKVFRTYVLLDSQSDSCFVSGELTSMLEPPRTDVELKLTTMGSSNMIRSEMVTGLMMKGVGLDRLVKLPKCYSRESIPANRALIPNPKTLVRWQHLQEAIKKMPDYDPELSVGMLVGFNCPSMFIPRACRQAEDDQPFAVCTSLGWMVMGGNREKGENDVTVHRTLVQDVKHLDFAAAFDLDFAEPRDRQLKMSQDEVLFAKCVQSSLHQNDDGHYEMDLPFRQEPEGVPNNRPMALKRLMHLKRRLQKSQEYCEKYGAFMAEMLGNGYAEVVEHAPETGKVLYTPHHGVESASKPGQIRPVFDGAAVFEGVSLNSLLLSGSEDPNNLAGVLCNFRDEAVGFMCDVKSMFYQVRVSDKHRDFLRFLWFANGDPNGEIIECRMCVHVFGATSSPSCANVAFRRNAEDQAEKYGQEVVDFIKRQFYVDDGLASRARANEVVRLFMQSHELCREGGFYLCKFVCSDPDVLRQIPSELMGKAVKEWRVSGKDLPALTSLGLIWDLLRDAFRFVVQEFVKKMTRRGLLSALCSIYDPLGLIAPVVLVGRLIVQGLCTKALAWDAEISVEDADRWRTWYAELKALEEISIPRCIRATTSGMQVNVELHHFCDASQLGYGVCSYARLSSETGEVDVSLMYAKARVAPKKAVTMPRMELQAAVLGVRTAEFLNQELIYRDVKNHFWSDSKVVLGYIKNSTRRFQLYVANRVTTIRESTDPEQWNYVPTDLNPADLASRGVSPQQLRDSRLWWQGPTFVSRGEKPDGADDTAELDDDPEVKKTAVVMHMEIGEQSAVERLLARSSDWRRATRVWAWCRRYIQRCSKAKIASAGPLIVEELVAAERDILQQVQSESFKEELEILAGCSTDPASRDADMQRKRELKVRSSLYRLSAFQDDEGTLRVGGRLKNADLPFHVRYPALLPRKHRLTELIVLDSHQRSGHTGRQATLARVRNGGFWITSGRAAVDRCTRSCVTCRRLKSTAMDQKMADLPRDRVTDAPPFVYSGVDIFGPYLVKEGRSFKKRWVCIFVCMIVKAAHLEPLHSLSTDSFLHAFRRFKNRRGAVQMLRSDCGTNFVGVQSEMKGAESEMDEDVVHAELTSQKCEWVSMKFNAPKASHMGGIWERPIQSIKKVFNSILHGNPDQLTDEIFSTFLTEAEGIYNSRPITPVDMTDPLAEPPLCPGDLLSLKRANHSAFPGVFPPEDVYSRKHWRRVQQLRQTFMTRWRKEYLLTLQPRKKWNQVRRNLVLGDVVLVVNAEAHRSDWTMGLVTEVNAGRDGLVRTARVKTLTGDLTRPVHKLVFLVSSGEPEELERSNLPSPDSV